MKQHTNQIKKLLSLLLAALLCLSIAACASSDGGSGSGGGGDASGSGASEAEPDGEKKVLKLAHLFAESSEGTDVMMSDPYQWMVAAKEKFEEENAGYEVELEYMDSNSINTKLMTDAAAGVVHDVCMTQSAEMPQHIQANSLYDISEYFNAWSEEDQAEFNWNPVWGNLVDADGGLYAIPFGLHTRTLAYRKSMFEAAGLDPNDPPKTYDEVLEYAQILTDKENDVWGLGLYLGPHQATCEVVLMPMVWSRGGTIFDDATQKATFTDPACVESLKWIYDCVYTYEVSPSWTMSGEQSETLLAPFLEGQFAMAFGIGNYWLSETEAAGLTKGAYPATSEVESDVAWCVVPDEGGVLYCNAWLLSVHANTSDPDMAFKLLETALDEDIIGLSESYGGLPARASAYEGDVYSADFWQTWYHLAMDKGHIAPVTPYYNNLKDAIVQATQDIITNQNYDDIESILKQYEDDFNAQYASE